MELRYKSGALTDIEVYLRWYEDVFSELFSDTGLKDELKIIQEHSDRAAHLKVEILRAVHDHVVEEPVLGRKKKGKFYELCFYAGNRLVIVCYTDDKKGGIRWIESILLGQKR